MEGPVAMTTYGNFVTQFVMTMEKALEGDAVHKKRQKVMSKVRSAPSANLARFALGGDNGVYLIAGISLLHVDNEVKFDLAPSELYSSDVLEATKRGLAAGKMQENATRRADAPDELERLFYALLPFARLFANDAASGMKAPEYDLAATEVLKVEALIAQGREVESAGTKGFRAIPDAQTRIRLMRELAAFFYNIVNQSDASVGSFLNDIMQTIYHTPNVLLNQPFPVGSVLASGGHDVVQRALAIGVCDYVAPNSTDAFCNGINAMVDYAVPEGMERSIKYSHRSMASKNAATIETSARDIAAEHTSPRRHSEISLIQASMSLDGKYTLAEHAACTQGRAAAPTEAKWGLDGNDCVELASAALLGHTIGRLRDVASTDTSLSDGSKKLLAHTRAVLKLEQLDHMRVINGSAGTGAPLPTPPVVVAQDFINEARTVRDYLRALVERTLYYAFVPSDEDVQAEFNSLLPNGSAEERRSGLWTEFMRDMAISTDRVWTFIRTLSGLIGEGADTLITTADEASQRAAKEVQAQRKQIADRVAQLQTRIVETLISGLLKDSTLQLATGAGAANTMVVVDGDTAKQIRDLASGESGRPFFEANVALRNLTDSTRSSPQKLGDVVEQFSTISETLKQSREAQLLPSAGVAGATLGELALPRNSYFVKLRDDTVAAIRAAFDRWESERGIHGGIRHIYLWELVEGADNMLSSRFAEFVGHVLIQNRTSTGISAIYTSRQQAAVNAAQARVALTRLLNQAMHYVSKFPKPNFEHNAGTARKAYFVQSAAASSAETVAWSTGMPGVQMRGQLVSLAGWHGGLRY